MLLLCFFQTNHLFQYKIKCMLHSICFPFYFLHNFYPIRIINLFQEEHKKLYLKSLSISFFNKCKLVFFAYKKRQME